MLDNLSIQSENNRNNNPLLPNFIRACIIGKSGCGKTNLLLNLLLNDFGDIPILDYNHLYLFGKSLHQPEYQLLVNALKNKIPRYIIRDLIKNKLTNNKIIKKIGTRLEYNNIIIV
jgi:ABC-type dipeptide/oligopeptide/nickel transport system ATPase subunit